MDKIFLGVSLFSFLSITEQTVVFLQRGVARSLQLVFDLLAFRWPMLTLMDSVVWCMPFRLCWGCRVDWYGRCKENRRSAPNSLNLNPQTSWTCWVFYFKVAGPNFVPNCCEWNRIVGRTSSHTCQETQTAISHNVRVPSANIFLAWVFIEIPFLFVIWQ